MVTFRISIILAVLWTMNLLLPAESPAVEKLDELKIPQTLSAGLQHFLDLVDPARKTSFDPEKVGRVLDFINEPKSRDALYFTDGISRGSSAYYEFDIQKSLEKLVGYSYNPEIPWIATVPSSVRLLYWLDARRNRQPSPRIGHQLDRLDSPVVVKGVQYIEITPDTHSGAYYAYDNYQTMVLFKYRQRKILVTISRQVDVSGVGKKGFILGADDNWDYFYSGKPGLTIPALGWVKSYLYSSSGINIYDEVDSAAPKVRCALFKWLKAGWSGINMVRREHIYSGLKRFAKPVKEILEYPSLPSVETMAGDFSRISGFPENALRSKMALYSDILQKRYDGRVGYSGKLPAELFKSKNFWTQMSQEEMESTLVIEYMKLAVGKTRKNEVGRLFE